MGKNHVTIHNFWLYFSLVVEQNIDGLNEAFKDLRAQLSSNLIEIVLITIVLVTVAVTMVMRDFLREFLSESQ